MVIAARPALSSGSSTDPALMRTLIDAIGSLCLAESTAVNPLGKVTVVEGIRSVPVSAATAAPALSMACRTMRCRKPSADRCPHVTGSPFSLSNNRIAHPLLPEKQHVNGVDALPPDAGQAELAHSGSKGWPLTVASSATGAGLRRAARVKQVASAILIS